MVVLACYVWRTTYWKLLCMWAGWDLLALSCRYRIWKKKKNREQKKKVRGSERKKKRKCKHCVLRKGAHSVPIRLCVITEDWWNVSSGPVLLQVQTASHKTYTHTHTVFTGLHLFLYDVYSVILTWPHQRSLTLVHNKANINTHTQIKRLLKYKNNGRNSFKWYGLIFLAVSGSYSRIASDCRFILI